jgi:hypothetical protein
MISIGHIGVPKKYQLTSLLMIVFGIPMMLIIPRLPPPQLPIVVFLMIISPLVFGFGMTLWLEGLISRPYFPVETRWRALMTANAVSYVFLFVMLLFFAPNPYTEVAGSFRGFLFGEINQRENPSKIIAMLHDYRAPVFHLLGLSKDDSPGPNYEPYVEMSFLTDLSELPGLDSNFNPWAYELSTALRIADDTLAIPTLASDAQPKLTIIREYLVFCSRILDAVRNSDQQAFDTAYAEWTEWWNSHRYAMNNGLDDPSLWIRRFRRDESVKIVLPPEPSGN